MNKIKKILFNIKRYHIRLFNDLAYEQFRLWADVLRWQRDRFGKKEAYNWIKVEDL